MSELPPDRPTIKRILVHVMADGDVTGAPVAVGGTSILLKGHSRQTAHCPLRALHMSECSYDPWAYLFEDVEYQ
jgi:hypothetical protein